MLRNIEMVLAYDGTNFQGFQIQPSVRTVQGTLNQVLRKLLGENVQTCGSSRTDSGVHAHDLHATFSMKNSIPLASLERALNHHLPVDLRLLALQEKYPGFSARRNATGKHYAYIVGRGPNKNPFLGRYALFFDRALSVPLMNQASSLFMGLHEFSSLRSARDERPMMKVDIQTSIVEKRGEWVIFHVIGHSFLYNMVRNMMGALIKVGLGEWTLEDFSSNLFSGDRTRMGMTVPGHALHLLTVFYGDEPLQIQTGIERLFQNLSL